jgi:hypothetical protein
MDILSNLYCSLHLEHRVVKMSLDGSNTTVITIAGTGLFGSASNQLRNPRGIFVDLNLNLYVADSQNDRIQFFRRGQLYGITVAGNGIPNNLYLNFSTDVILDADGFLYIADNKNSRIIRSGQNGFECIAGCTGKSGTASNELSTAYAMRLDSRGNLYVVDENNGRIQKFSLATNSCGKLNRKLFQKLLLHKIT